VETLFDLREFSEKRACATCGTEFLPSQKPQRFCCPKCKRVFFQRKEAARIKARFEFTQNNQVPLPENLSELDKEAVRLHTDPTRKKRLGIRSIASLQECKICTKSNIFSRAIGQAFLAKAEKKDVWFVIPDDISMRKDQVELLQQFQIPIFSETSLRQKLLGEEPVEVQTKTTAAKSFPSAVGAPSL